MNGQISASDNFCFITYNGTCLYAVQVLNFNNGYNFQSMAYTQCYAAKRTVKNYVGIH